VADLVDRFVDWSPGVADGVLTGPPVPDRDEIARLREEIRELRLHLEMAHECCFPKGEGDG
jgi:hypothetical protein